MTPQGRRNAGDNNRAVRERGPAMKEGQRHRHTWHQSSVISPAAGNQGNPDAHGAARLSRQPSEHQSAPPRSMSPQSESRIRR